MRPPDPALRVGREAVRLVAGGLERLAIRWPRPGLAALGRLGSWSALDPGARKTPTAEELVSLFGRIEGAEIHRIRREIAAAGHRNHALREIQARRGLAAGLPRLVRVDPGPLPRLVEAGTPVVVAGWHQGPARATALALARLGIPALLATTERPRFADLPPTRFFHLAEAGRDAAFLKEALAMLRAGGVVVAHLDWRSDRGHPAVFLGRRIALPRGGVFLARTAGARLVPTTRAWIGEGADFEVAFHEPFPEPSVPADAHEAYETALLEMAAAWFDARIRERPGTLRNDRIRRLLDAPSLLPGAAGSA